MHGVRMQADQRARAVRGRAAERGARGRRGAKAHENQLREGAGLVRELGGVREEELREEAREEAVARVAQRAQQLTGRKEARKELCRVGDVALDLADDLRTQACNSQRTAQRRHARRGVAAVAMVACRVRGLNPPINPILDEGDTLRPPGGLPPVSAAMPLRSALMRFPPCCFHG